MSAHMRCLLAAAVMCIATCRLSLNDIESAIHSWAVESTGSAELVRQPAEQRVRPGSTLDLRGGWTWLQSGAIHNARMYMPEIRPLAVRAASSRAREYTCDYVDFEARGLEANFARAVLFLFPSPKGHLAIEPALPCSQNNRSSTHCLVSYMKTAIENNLSARLAFLADLLTGNLAPRPGPAVPGLQALWGLPDAVRTGLLQAFLVCWLDSAEEYCALLSTALLRHRRACGDQGVYPALAQAMNPFTTPSESLAEASSAAALNARLPLAPEAVLDMPLNYSPPLQNAPAQARGYSERHRPLLVALYKIMAVLL